MDVQLIKTLLSLHTNIKLEETETGERSGVGSSIGGDHDREGPVTVLFAHLANLIPSVEYGEGALLQNDVHEKDGVGTETLFRNLGPIVKDES